jgi:putative SOS response-associated peptidase YedK
MCYAPGPELMDGRPVYKLPRGDYKEPMQQELIELQKDGFHYPKNTLGVIVQRQEGLQVLPMRFDLIPPGYMADHPEMTLAEVIKKKNSRAINPDTQKKWGYDSYNARSETIATTWSFKSAWKAGRRCIMPAVRFKERPNMDDAPREFKGREWQVNLHQRFYFGCIWERLERNGQALESCAIVTLDSVGQSKIRAIWHERMPVLLNDDEALEWLNPATPLPRIKELVKQLGPEWMDLEEKVRVPKSAA